MQWSRYSDARWCALAAVCFVAATTGHAADEWGGVPLAPPGYGSDRAVIAGIATGRVQLAGPLDYDPETVDETHDVEYGRVDDRPLLLDVYRPAGLTETAPCVVIIHGGGWRSGDKRQNEYRHYIYPLVERGYVAVSVGYRLSGEAPYPAAVQDAMCAIRYLRRNSETWGIDPERIGVMGWSAGAHLAMMIGYAGGVERLNRGGGSEGEACEVRCIVNLYGPCDLTVDYARDHRLVTSFMGTTYDEAPELYVEASPLTHLDASAPPTLIIHGTIDSLVSIDQADRLAAALNAAGVPYLFDRVDGWPHVLDLERNLHERTKFMMFRFLDHYLKADTGKGKQTP